MVYEADDDASSKEGEEESRLSADEGPSLDDRAMEGSEGRDERSQGPEEGVRLMSKEMIAQEKALEEEYTKRQSEFDLQRELEKIHCSKYLDRLVDMGFVDAVSAYNITLLFVFLYLRIYEIPQGAFSHLTEEVLSGPGLWVARTARLRILALADALRRKDKKMREKIDIREKMESEMLENKGLNLIQMEGVDGEQFRTKAEMRRAWTASKPSRADGFAGASADGASIAMDDDMSSLSAAGSIDLMSLGGGSVPVTPRRPIRSAPAKIIPQHIAKLMSEIERC